MKKQNKDSMKNKLYKNYLQLLLLYNQKLNWGKALAKIWRGQGVNLFVAVNR